MSVYNPKQKYKEGQQTEKEIYLTIIRYVKEHGYYPMTSEIGEELNISVYTVRRHIRLLLAKGYLETDHDYDNATKGYRVTGWEFKRKNNGKNI